MDEIQSKSVNKASNKPKVDEVKKDIEKIQENKKQKPSIADTKKSEKAKNKTIEKTGKVESLKKDNKPNTVTDEESKSNTVKETKIKENVKSAKDWGRASNDPRNKS